MKKNEKGIHCKWIFGASITLIPFSKTKLNAKQMKLHFQISRESEVAMMEKTSRGIPPK